MKVTCPEQRRDTQGPPEPADGTLPMLSLDQIEPHPCQPREDFDGDELEELAESLKRHDLVQLPLVRLIGPGRYQLICGERRLRAARLAGWTSMPVRVRELTDGEALELMGVENLLRQDLNPIEVARYLQILCSPREEGGAAMTRYQAGARFGRTGTWAIHRLHLLKFPKRWQNRVARGELAYTTLAALAAYAERPDVLDAIEADMKENPWAWRNHHDFRRNAKLIAETSSAVVNREPKPPKALPETATPQVTANASASARRTREDSRPAIASGRDTSLERRFRKALSPYRNDKANLERIRKLVHITVDGMLANCGNELDKKGENR